MPPATRETAPAVRRPPPPAAVILAIVLFGTAIRTNSPGGGLAVTVATFLLAFAIWTTRRDGSIEVGTAGSESQLLGAILVFSLMGLIGWAPSGIGPTSPWLERLPSIIWAGSAVWLFRGNREGKRVLAALVAIVVGASLVVGVLNLREAADVNLDVNLLHRAAANALSGGLNPYTDAVEVPNGSPTADEGDTIVGYPYPPVAAIAYSVGEWLFSDPRFTSLIVWLATLTLLGVHGVRRNRPEPVYLMILLASIPGWPLILRAAWTEPLTLLLMTAAFVLWRRPGRSGSMLGLGLASKQYLAVSAPLVLLHRDLGWVKRVIVAAVVATATIAVAVFADASAFWTAAVEFHLNTPVRTDSTNVVGLVAAMGADWHPPAYLSLAAGLITAVAVGRVSRKAGVFMAGMALILAVSFLFATQAFANYWFLVAGLCALGLLPTHPEEASA